MKRLLTRRGAALGLCLCLFFVMIGGCAPQPAPTQTTEPVPAETGTEAPPVIEPQPLELESVRNEGPTPENAVTWRSVFYDRSLPASGYLTDGQAAFYLEGEDGSSVVVLDQAQLLETVAALEPLPRTHYLEELLDDESFTVLFAAFDLAMELGARKFCFSTDSIRSTDVVKKLNYISYTFPLANGDPSFTCSKEYSRENGERFHYMTVSLAQYTHEDMVKYLTALAKARSVVAGMPEGLDEVGKASYLYLYTVNSISYHNDDEYYEQEEWNCLYDAMILGSAVCTGYAEALYVLYNLAGIDCLYVNGYVYDKIVFGGHAWNLAKVKGDWYVFDATWDSSFTELFHDPVLFGVSDETAVYYGARTYSKFWEEFAPACGKVLDPDALACVPPE